jgi:hypothetical protein
MYSYSVYEQLTLRVHGVTYEYHTRTPYTGILYDRPKIRVRIAHTLLYCTVVETTTSIPAKAGTTVFE